MWVIMKGRLYVAQPGSKKSYTTKLENARKFSSRESAESDACGNEAAVSMYDILQ
ncbi:MAG: hypothetical protein ACK52I_15150 [Pseudomonadota bacterium]|jgi:hypothetical protein